MHLCNLDLYGFRNYRQLHLEADPGVNLIVGCNAQGKTNLLEAISFLGSGRSWRAGKVRELVRFDEEFGDLQAKIFSQGREQSIRCVLYPNGTKRQLWRNGVKKKTFAELSGLLPSVLFCPEDLMVLKSGASARRHLGDTALCQLRPNYDAALTEYGRVLDQKGRILKDYHENRSLLEILPEYNERLIQVGALLISYRARFTAAWGRKRNASMVCSPAARRKCGWSIGRCPRSAIPLPTWKPCEMTCGGIWKATPGPNWSLASASPAPTRTIST